MREASGLKVKYTINIINREIFDLLRQVFDINLELRCKLKS